MRKLCILIIACSTAFLSCNNSVVSDGNDFPSTDEESTYKDKLSKLSFYISPMNDSAWIETMETSEGRETIYDINCTLINTSDDTICFQVNSGNDLRHNLQYDTTNFAQFIWFHCNASWSVNECVYPKKSHTFLARIIRRTTVNKLSLLLEDLVFVENSMLIDSTNKPSYLFSLNQGKYFIRSNEIILPEIKK